MAYRQVTDAFDHMSLQDRHHAGYSGRDSHQQPAPQHQSSPAPYQHHHQQQPDAGHRAPPTPAYSPPAGKPPIQPGWIPQFDHRYQCWYYHDPSSGRSQWEAPARGGGDSRGVLGAGHNTNSGVLRDGQPKTSGGKGGMLLGAAGGLAAGALVAHALHDSDSDRDDDDDDDDDKRYPRDPASYGGEYVPAYAAPYAGQTYQAAPAPAVPAYNTHGEPVDESDRESVEEAREEYEEAYVEAHEPGASSSDEEELEETRREYVEEYDEAYYDD